MTPSKLTILALTLSTTATVRADESPAAVVEAIGVDEKLGSRLPLDLELTDAAGARVRLGDLFAERPVLLALVYYRCPMLCGESLDGLVRAMRVLSLDLGREFDLVTVSFDPEDGPADAARQKRGLLAKLGEAPDEPSVRFLTASQPSIDALTGAVGFRYARGAAPGQFAHAAGVVVLTPEARVSRYFYGIEYSARDLQFALMEAADERIGSPVAQVLLYCYQYDPSTGRYGFVVLNALRLAGILTVAAISVFIGLSLRRERARASEA